jgi:hypothetical protein
MCDVLSVLLGWFRAASGGNTVTGVAVCHVWGNSVLCCCCMSPLQFHILREKGTEPPGSGQYNKHYEKGVYKCAGCGSPLYK